MKRLLTGMAALAAVAFVLLGWPILLIKAATGPLAEFLPSLDNPGFTLTHPAASGLLLALVVLLGLGAWVVTAAALVVELAAQARGLQAPSLGGLFPQGTMARVASAVVIMLPTVPAMAPAHAATVPAAVVQLSQSGPAASDVDAADQQHTYRVQEGDTLWKIAEQELGDARRYMEIFHASHGIRQPDGSHLRDPRLVRPGWTLRIPVARATASDHRGQSGPGKSRPTQSGPAQSEPSQSRAAAIDRAPTAWQPEATRVPHGALPESRNPAAVPTTTAPQGGGPSPAIDRAPVTPMHSLDRATPAAVPAPVGLRATGISATSADLSWSDPAGVDVVGYQVTVAGRTRVVDAPHFQLADLAPDQIHEVAVVTITASGASQPVTTSLRTCAAVPTTPMRRAAANPSLASNLAQLSRFGSTHAELAARAHGRPRPSSEGVAAFATSLGIDPSRLSAKGV